MSKAKQHSFKSACSIFILLSSTLFINKALAEPFMTKSQYEDYSVRYQCAELQHYNDLAKKEEVILKLEEDFNITDDTFEALDELIPLYEKDSNLLDNVRARVNKGCS